MTDSRILVNVYISDDTAYLSAEQVIRKCADSEYLTSFDRFPEDADDYFTIFDKYVSKLEAATRDGTVQTVENSRAQPHTRERFLKLLLEKVQFRRFFESQKFEIRSLFKFDIPVRPLQIPPELLAMEPSASVECSHSWRALNMLLTGCEITHPDFQAKTRSWRLGAYVKVLRKLGWPIETRKIPSPTPECAGRFIARYVLQKWVRDEIGGLS